LHELSADDARAKFSAVSQHTHLFNVTVRDNLLLANPDASDEQIMTACCTAQVHDFIQSLPQGYDTLNRRERLSFERRTTAATGHPRRLA